MDQFISDIALSNKFPGKLWRMVNSCTSGAIGWSQGGHTIIIHQTKFQQEYLDPPNCIFKTSNIGSFIRQLNLYGFRKLNALKFAESADSEVREIHEFQNDFFVQGRPDLLSRLRRNVGIRRSRELAVKRRLEIFHTLPRKMTDQRQRFHQFSGPTSGPSAGGHSHRSIMCPGSVIRPSRPIAPPPPPPPPPAPQMSPVSVTTKPTTTEMPVFLQWDGHSYKYVVLPESSVQSNQHIMHQNIAALQRAIQQQAQQQAQQQIQQQQREQQILVPRHDVQNIHSHLEKDREGNNLHIVHIPDEDGKEPQQYYVVSLLPMDESNENTPCHTQLPQKMDTSEYIDMYEMARKFASNNQSSPPSDDTLLSSSRRRKTSPKLNFIQNDDTGSICGDMDTPDSSPRILTRDASLPSVGGLDIESPCMITQTGPNLSGIENGIFSYDIIDKSELDVYIRGHDDDLILFPGVSIGAGGDGMTSCHNDDAICDSQDKECPIPNLDKPVIVESIESQYRKRTIMV